MNARALHVDGYDTAARKAMMAAGWPCAAGIPVIAVSMNFIPV